MKYKQNRHIAKLIFMTIMAFALSGGCFFVGMNWSTWFPSVAEGPVNPDPMVQDPNTSGGNPKAIADTNKYTDFTYKGKVYRVEKSLLTENGSKYNTNSTIYRFLNNKWEMKEDVPHSIWKPAKLVDIPIVLAGWNKKFKSEEAKNKSEAAPPKETAPKTTPPIGSPPIAAPPNVKAPPLSPPRADFDQIKKEVILGHCNADCIRSIKGLSASQIKKLLELLP